MAGGWDMLLGNPVVYQFLAIIFMGAMGLASGKLTVGAFSGFLTFAHFATNTGNAFLTNLLYVVIVIGIVLMSLYLGSMALSDGGGMSS